MPGNLGARLPRQAKKTQARDDADRRNHQKRPAEVRKGCRFAAAKGLRQIENGGGNRNAQKHGHLLEHARQG